MEIKIKIPKEERDFLEWCLNMECSGEDSSFFFLFYALGVSMHIDDLIYYRNLLEEVKNG